MITLPCKMITLLCKMITLLCKIITLLCKMITLPCKMITLPCKMITLLCKMISFTTSGDTGKRGTNVISIPNGISFTTSGDTGKRGTNVISIPNVISFTTSGEIKFRHPHPFLICTSRFLSYHLSLAVGTVYARGAALVHLSLCRWRCSTQKRAYHTIAD